MSREEDKNILLDNPTPTISKEWIDIQPPCRIYNLLSYQDIMYLNKIARSNKLAGNPSKKKKMIIELMEARGFKKLDCGTNRLVFKFMENQSFLIKVAFDKVALNDNLREMHNQEFLKPFCAKCFEVTPCGTVGMFERVYAVKSREEFASIADRVFDIIVNCFLGKFVLADFGTKFYKNWGVRKKAYPVILDYPYLYELDGGKLFCNKQDPLSETGYCRGEIDYDDGFNFLVCKKCGKTYLASELSKERKNKNIMVFEREENRMKIEITKRDGTVIHLGDQKKSSTYRKNYNDTPSEYRLKKSLKHMKVTVEKVDTETGEVVDSNKKVETSSLYGEMMPAADDGIKKMVVTLQKGDKEYVGKAPVRYPNMYDIRSRYPGIYGEGAQLVQDNNEYPENEEVVDSTASDVTDDGVVRNVEVAPDNAKVETSEPETQEKGTTTDESDTVVESKVQEETTAVSEPEEMPDNSEPNTDEAIEYVKENDSGDKSEGPGDNQNVPDDKLLDPNTAIELMKNMNANTVLNTRSSIEYKHRKYNADVGTMYTNDIQEEKSNDIVDQDTVMNEY